MFDCCVVGMNAAVRAVVRMGIYVGCKVFLIKEVRPLLLCLQSQYDTLHQVTQIYQ